MGEKGYELDARATGAQLRRYLGRLTLNKHRALFGELVAADLEDSARESGVGYRGYVLGVIMLAHDCKNGVDGVTHKPMPRGLVGLPEEVYGDLVLQGLRWGEEAFGEEFGRAVRGHAREIWGRLPGGD